MLNRFNVILAASLCLIACAGPTAQPTAAQNAALPAYDGPAQSPVAGQGSGVTMNVALRRGSESFGQNSSTPTWEVNISVANYTNGPVSFGDMLVVFETIAGSDDTLGLYMARTGFRQTQGPAQIEGRRGLDWGVTVGAGESTPWPWGAVPGGSPMSANNAFMLLLSAPWAKGFARGGFPVVEARSQYVLNEKIMAPVGLRTTREAAVVLPPRILLAAPQPALQPVFVFREDAARNSFQQVSREDLPVTGPALGPIAGDAAAPLWKRIMALDLLAETDFASTQTRLVQIAEDGAAPLRLRASAMLNLGVNRYAPGVEVMKRIFAAPSDPRLALIALEALGEIGDASAAPTVRGAIGAADQQRSRVAIRNAARLKDSEAVAPIVAALGASREEGLMSLCVDALSKIGTPQAWDRVIGVANNARAPFQARRVAIVAIGEHAYAPGESALIALLSGRGSDKSIQLNVISALGHFNDDAAVAAMVAVAGARDDTVAGAAVGALARIKTLRAVEELVRIAGTAGHGQSAEAMSKLGEARNAVAIAPLRAVLSDAARGGADRAAAFTAIKSIDAAQIADADRSALWAAFTATRQERPAEQVARALIDGGFNDRSVVPALIAGLDERRNDAWFANVLLLRHLTGQTIGPEYRFGSRDSHEADFARWRTWAAKNAAP